MKSLIGKTALHELSAFCKRLASLFFFLITETNVIFTTNRHPLINPYCGNVSTWNASILLQNKSYWKRKLYKILITSYWTLLMCSSLLLFCFKESLYRTIEILRTLTFIRHSSLWLDIAPWIKLLRSGNVAMLVQISIRKTVVQNFWRAF